MGLFIRCAVQHLVGQPKSLKVVVKCSDLDMDLVGNGKIVSDFVEIEDTRFFGEGPHIFRECGIKSPKHATRGNLTLRRPGFPRLWIWTSNPSI
ncbi:hypothetical protein PAXRUDRAFT_247059, partial [Paxillus rubicundulus Ve08.2h10]